MMHFLWWKQNIDILQLEWKNNNNNNNKKKKKKKKKKKETSLFQPPLTSIESVV